MVFQIGKDEWPSKLNIGCGYDKRPDYLNVDVDPTCEPDILIVNNDLSHFPDGWFQEVRAWDVLEHIPHAFTVIALLDWAALLKMGGQLVLQTSSVYGVIDTMRASPSFETEYNWMRCLFGNQVHPGDFHHYGFTETTLRVFLHVAGFDPGPFTLMDGWLLGCTARKVRDWTDLLELDDERMLKAASERFLKRELPTEAVDHYLNLLRSGFSRRALVRELAAAPETLYKVGSSFTAGPQFP
jgi:hypothetical protein